MVKEAKKTRDEATGLGVIERYEKIAAERRQHAAARHGRINPSPATKLLSDAKRVNKWLDNGIEQLHLSALSDIGQALIIFGDLIKSARCVVLELERIQRLQATVMSGTIAASPSPISKELRH
jgi:hypothetical protein